MAVNEPTVPTSAARRVRNPQGQGVRLRAELVAAADTILAQAGDLEALSLRAVARAVGIATPSIYLHFPDKSSLVRAVLEARFAELTESVQRAVLAAHGPGEQLLAGCFAYCRFATEHPSAYRVLFGRAQARREATADYAEADTPTPVDGALGTTGGTMPGDIDLQALGSGAAAFGFLVDGVAGCMRVGVARPGDPMRVATALWTALHGIVSLRGSLPGFPWPSLEQQVEDAVIGLVGLVRLHHNPPAETER